MDRLEARTDELLDSLRKFAGRRIFAAVLGSPDPDGLASAWAFARIAAEVDVRVDILTFEVLSRPDNAAFVHLLGVPFKKVAARLPRVAYAGFAVVDRQNARLPVAHRPDLTLIAHIDHHAPVRTRALFSEQTTAFGSTSSIMAHHLANVIEKHAGDLDEASRIATALNYGIRTDTSDFLNANARDFEAASRLAPLVSTEMIRAIALTPLGRPFLDTLATALRSMTTRDGFTIAFAGRVGRRARDTIGQTADFVIRGEGTIACVVFGFVNGSLVGSLRSSDSNLDPNHFLDQALSTRFGFPVDCGGRTFAGGFMIPTASVGAMDEETLRATVAETLHAAWSARARVRKGGTRRK